MNGRFLGTVLCGGGGALLVAAVGMFVRGVESPRVQIATDGLESLSLVAHEEVIRSVVITNETGYPLRLVNETGLGCDRKLCTNWEQDVVTEIEAGERRVVPFRVTVHRPGDFKRIHHFYFSGGDALWDVVVPVQGVAIEANEPLAKGS